MLCLLGRRFVDLPLFIRPFFFFLPLPLLQPSRAIQRESYSFRDFDPRTKLYTPITDERRINELLAEYSPITHVSADDPPMLIIHGQADNLVPLQQASKMIDKLRAQGVPAELVIAKGKGHGWSDQWTNEMKHIADWFDVHLAKKE